MVAISHDCDLALLEVDDKAFGRGIKPSVVGDLPKLRDGVQVVGYPIGGEEVSITEGVVSRIEVQRYEHSQRHLLTLPTSAAARCQVRPSVLLVDTPVRHRQRWPMRRSCVRHRGGDGLADSSNRHEMEG